MVLTTEIIVFPDSAGQARGAATHLIAQAADAIAARGQMTIALAGGSTPEATYRLLATEAYAEQIDWSRVHVFWGDERCVPPNDTRSNYFSAQEALLRWVPLPSGNIHRIRGEKGPNEAAQAYADELVAFFGSRWPKFDLTLLGLGIDGHTASLFPGATALGETDCPVAAVLAKEAGGGVARVTLTVRAINRGRDVVFLVAGAEKATMVQAVLEGSPDRYPAQRIRPRTGRLIWLLDEQAAKRLEETAWRSARSL